MTTEVATGMIEKKLENLLYKILLLHYIKDDYALEFQNSFFKLAIGMTFFFWGNVIFNSNPDYYKNITWISNILWGVTFFVTGTIHLYALFSRRPVLRKWILLWAGFLWTTYAISLLVGDPRFPGGYIFSIAALSSFRCYLCIQVFNTFRLHKTIG